MRLLPDPDSLEFAASVRELLARSCDSDALRSAWDGDTGRVPGLWQRLAEVGATGLTVPEAFAGAGMPFTAAVPVLVELGRAAAPEPLVATLAGTALLAGAGGDVAAHWLPLVAAGEATLAFGEGYPALLAGGRWADLLLVATDAGVQAVTPDEVTVNVEPSIDPGVGLVTVEGAARGGPLGGPVVGGRVVAGADPLAAYDLACVAVAAELVGLAQAMLDMSVGYAGQREQFGKPIGSFQAVKHQLADVYVATAFAVPVVHRAAWSVTHALPSRGRDASHAKLAAGAAAERAARTALQVHAGIGYTYEHDLHMWMKRTWSLTSLWGGASMHAARVRAAVLAASPAPRVP